MFKKLIPVLLFAFTSCKNDEKKAVGNSENSIIDKEKISPQKEDSIKRKTILVVPKETTEEIARAKNWLIPAIESYLNKQNGLQENTNEEAEGNTKSIFTKQYEEYKDDATNVDLDVDGSLTEKKFNEKWKSKYNTKYAGIGVGILISGQDWGLIKVTKCNYVTHEDKVLIFNVIIRDTENNIDYQRDIKVIPSGKSFLICDILEYN